MVPSSAMQMALANLLRGAQPKQQTPPLGDVEAVVGALPPIPGLPGASGGAPMSGQLALANALAGKTGEQSPIPVAPPPMGPATTPPPAGVAPETGQGGEGGMFGDMDLSAILAGDLERQRERASAIGRQRAVGNLGLLTGDRVLSNFGQAQLNQAEAGNPNSLRYLDLLQKQQRLSQQATTEERQGRQGDKRLGLAEQDYKTRSALGWAGLGQRKQEHIDDVEAAKRAAERQRLKDIESTQDKLRGEFTGNPVVKQLPLREASFTTVQTLANDPNPANDIAFIYAVMSTFDPSSIVKDNEFATAQNAAGVPDRIRNAVNKVKEGTILSPRQRKEFTEAARIYLESQRREARKVASDFEQTARRSGVDPRFVIQENAVSGFTPSGPTRTTPGSLPTGADGNPTLDAPAPASAPQDGLPPIVSTRGMKPGDLAKSLEQGQRVRTRDPDNRGKFITFEKRGERLIRVQEN